MNCPCCGFNLESQQVTISKKRIDDFFKKVLVVESGCWEWQGSTSSPPRYPYGNFSLNGKSCYSHRWMMIFVMGYIPAGMDVLHRCDNPKCVNLFHLRIGTHEQNMREMSDKGRAGIRIGPDHPNYKITPELINKVESLISAGCSIEQIKEKTGLSKASAWRIASKHYEHRKIK